MRMIFPAEHIQNIHFRVWRYMHYVYVHVYVFVKYHDTNTQRVVYLLHAATSAYAQPSYTFHITHTSYITQYTGQCHIHKAYDTRNTAGTSSEHMRLDVHSHKHNTRLKTHEKQASHHNRTFVVVPLINKPLECLFGECYWTYCASCSFTRHNKNELAHIIFKFQLFLAVFFSAIEAGGNTM